MIEITYRTTGSTHEDMLQIEGPEKVSAPDGSPQFACDVRVSLGQPTRRIYAETPIAAVVNAGLFLQAYFDGLGANSMPTF